MKTQCKTHTDGIHEKTPKRHTGLHVMQLRRVVDLHLAEACVNVADFDNDRKAGREVELLERRVAILLNHREEFGACQRTAKTQRQNEALVRPT